MGLQKSKYLHASLTSFKSALSSVFVAFGSVESSRCFIFPSGHLTSPPEGISMCEQAQKERNEVYVWILFDSRSSLNLLWKLFGNRIHWLWDPVRFRKSKSQTQSSMECLYHNQCKKKKKEEEEREKLWLKFDGLDKDGPWSHDHSTAWSKKISLTIKWQLLHISAELAAFAVFVCGNSAFLFNLR